MKNRNFVIMWLRDSLIAFASALTSSSVLSGALLHIGMGEEKISLYLAFVPFVNLAISLLFSGITSKTKKTIPAYTLLCLLSGVFTCTYALIFSFSFRENIAFFLLMLAGCLVTAVTAVRTIFDYKLPCEVMESDEYSLYVSVGGILGSAFGIAAGALLSLAYKKSEFNSVTCAAFLLAGASLCAASFINRALKLKSMGKTAENQKAGRASGDIAALFKNKTFLRLCVPNFIRGIGMATVPMMTVFAVGAGVIAETDGAAVTVCTYLGTLISCSLYAFLSRKVKIKTLCMGGALLFCVIAVSLSGGRTEFFICYTLAYIGYYAVSCAVPDLVYRNIESDIMSVFHTWRLALSTVGTTVSTALMGRLIGKVPPLWFLVAAAVSHIICAAAYAFEFSKNKNKVILRK